MAKVECHQCKEEISGGAKVQHFDIAEPTTIQVFCSEKCKDDWLVTVSEKQ